MKDLKISGLQHLGIPVTNMETSCGFYESLGFFRAYETTLSSASETTRVAMLTLGNLTIELYEKSGSEKQTLTTRADGSVDHIALDVADIDEMYAEIKSRGMVILENDPPVFLPFWKNGVKYFTVRGPDGEKVEFNQII